MNALFFDDSILDEYEQGEQWDKCIEYLNVKMLEDKKNRNILFRLSAQCWYTLTFWDCSMPKERLDRTLFTINLQKAFAIAQKELWNDSNCLWLFGYFMCINQLDFLFINSDIRDVEKEGNALIHRSFSINPNNPLAKVLYLADNDGKSKYFAAKKHLKKTIKQYFPSKSEVDTYFSEIFTNIY